MKQDLFQIKAIITQQLERVNLSQIERENLTLANKQLDGLIEKSEKSEKTGKILRRTKEFLDILNSVLKAIFIFLKDTG